MYVPEWETLAKALARLVQHGIAADEAKADLCGAIADRKIAFRAKVADKGEALTAGKFLVIPSPLHHDTIDWANSRPIVQWESRFVGNRPSFSGVPLPRDILYLEVRRADVGRELLHADDAPSGATTGCDSPGSSRTSGGTSERPLAPPSGRTTPQGSDGRIYYPPSKSIMTACEVITWIAFGRALPNDDLGTLFKVTVDRWHRVPADTVLEALEARAGLSGEARFFAIRKAVAPAGLDHYPSRHTIFTREGPALLRALRARHRRQSGKLLSYADLARMLHEEIEFDDKVSADMEDAKADLRDRVAGGALVAFGLPVRPDGSREAGALVRALPAELFMNRAITITEWDTAHADTFQPIKEWWNRKLPRFEEMQFRTAEVIALWPPRLVGGSQSVEPRASSSLPGDGFPGDASASAHELLRQLQLESCTLTDAVGRIAYGDKYDGRYHAPPGNQWADVESRKRRLLDGLYPSNSALPGIDYLATLDATERGAALAALARADERRWDEARAKLLTALMSGKIVAFDERGHAVPTEFWLSNDLKSLLARPLRLRARDLCTAGLVRVKPPPAGSPDEASNPSGALALNNELPASLASDPIACSAFAELRRYASEHIAQHGGPPKRDDAAKEINRRTSFPVRRARDLYRYLPNELRNPPRTAPP